MKKTAFCLVALAAIAMIGCDKVQTNMSSPDGRIEVSTFDGGLVMTCSADNNDRTGSLIINIPSLDSITEMSGPQLIDIDYTMIGGKKRHCTNQAHQYTVHYTDSLGEPYTLDVLLANDGLAFRNTGITDSVAPEVAYLLPEGQLRYNQRYTDPYEDFYPAATTGNQPIGRWGYPLLTMVTQGSDGRNDSDVWALITEAGVERGMRASWLEQQPSGPDTYAYRVIEGEAANGDKHHDTTPWRVVIMGRLADIVESTLVTDVSPASAIDDTSWIQPGSVSWIYWAYNHGSKDYQIVKQYIDMAAKLNLPYVLIDAEWDQMDNGGNIDDALSYAHTLGIKPMIWYNSSTAWPDERSGAPSPYYRLNDPADREREMQWLNDHGVAGVKIDFFDADKQSATDYSIDLIESAARHHLLVNLHGATLPRGWQRTYPNLLTTEAVYGAEWYNNLPILTNRAAAHNATLPFTRNVVGPMDYTPCTFSDSQHPHITTHAHELALPVLYESALQHWADKPESYLAQPAQVQHLISTLPTVWDETLLLGGFPGEYVVMARRNGDLWYVAAINGLDQPQEIAIDLSRLANAPEAWLIYADNDDAASPWSITTGPAPASVTLQPRGGIVLAPVHTPTPEAAL